MTVIVWPVDAVAGAPSNTGRMLREAQSVFMAGATTARPLGARSGVRPGTSATTVTATSTTWTLNACAGILDMETAAEAGPYAFAINTAQTGAVTAADATRPRIDLVWVRLDDPAESDGSAVPAVVAGYTAGAPLAIPVAPATPARCMVLSTIQVPMSGGGSPTVLWVAPYTVAAGGVLPVPAGVYPATPYVGQYVDDATLGLMRYNGTGWVGGVGTVLNAQSFWVGTSGATGADLWVAAASVTLAPGTWLVQAAMTVKNNTVSDSAAASIRNFTASTEVANSRGAADMTNTGTTVTSLISQLIPITVTTSTVFCPMAHPNGGTILATTITNTAGAPTGWITALRIA